MKIPFFLFFLFLLCLWNCNKKDNDGPYVVVLSMDGFRADYIEKAYTPTLDSLARTGVKSAFIPSFPSLTFPNHYSMATGLYPDHHGLVHNSFYAGDLDKIYRISDRQAVENPDFYQGEPIWNTAEKQGIKTAVYYWVGSETPIQNRQASIWKKFNKKIPFDDRADSVLSWLSLPQSQRPHLIMWYVEEPDATGHHCTPDSSATWKQVELLDRMLNRFFSKARQLPIYDKLNFIILSDHGMSTYYPQNYINLAQYLPRDSFEQAFDGVPTLLYPRKSYTDSAYAILSRIPRIRVWHKANMPTRYHYGTNPRVGELVVLPDPGTMLHFREHSTPSLGGAHGYDNFHPDMQAIFYATGPAFKKNYQHKPLPNVNLYPLITTLLGIKPAPHDGDIALVQNLLK